MGSASDEHDHLAQPLGKLLARLEVNLLTGAGRGVMTSVSRAFTQSERTLGVCIGIVPCADDPNRPKIENRKTRKDGYPNDFVELPINTHLPYSGKKGTHKLSRNHINILSSTAIVALPGGAGTASEVRLAVEYEKPIIAFTSDDSRVAEFPEDVPCVSRIEEVEAFLRKHINEVASLKKHLPRD